MSASATPPPPPVPPPSDWLAKALFELQGAQGETLAAIARLDERTKQVAERVGVVEQRLWWIIGLLVAALLGIVWRR